MRTVLQNPPTSLAVDMPLAPAGSSEACSERHTKELLELGQVDTCPYLHNSLQALLGRNVGALPQIYHQDILNIVFESLTP